MKLSSCPRCERHIDIDATSCPFCRTRLGTVPALNRTMLVAVLGLTISACNSNDGVGADLGGADYTGPGPLPLTETTETPPPDDDTRGTTETGATGGTGATGATGSSSGSATGPADSTGSGATGSGSGTGSGGTSSGGG